VLQPLELSIRDIFSNPANLTASTSMVHITINSTDGTTATARTATFSGAGRYTVAYRVTAAGAYRVAVRIPGLGGGITGKVLSLNTREASDLPCTHAEADTRLAGSPFNVSVSAAAGVASTSRAWIEASPWQVLLCPLPLFPSCPSNPSH